MDGDMPADGSNHPLPWAEKCVDYDGIGLRAADEKEDIGVRSGAALPNF